MTGGSQGPSANEEYDQLLDRAHRAETALAQSDLRTSRLAMHLAETHEALSKTGLNCPACEQAKKANGPGGWWR